MIFLMFVLGALPIGLMIWLLVSLAATRSQLGELTRALNALDVQLRELSRRIALSPEGPPAMAAAPGPAAPSLAPQPHGSKQEPAAPADVPDLADATPPSDAARVSEPPPEDIAAPVGPASEPDAGEAPADTPPQRVPPVAPAAAAPARTGPDFGDLEKRFGTQWVVWVGGVALALGGIFLVRYSIEQGLFGPGLRVLAGALLALVLAGLGEIARRREIVAGLADIPSAAHIPSILTAAGTTVAYADVWAAHALYGFLSPALAFLLLGAVALVTLAAALRHGPVLGGLGLIGAYVTPLLVASDQPNYWALYLYLAVVTAAAYALARIRLWRWLAITAAVFSILWMLVGIGDPRFGSLHAHAFHALAGYALAAFFLVPGLFQGPPPEPGRADPVSTGVLAGYLFGACMLAIATAHHELALLVLFALAAATVAAAWRADMVTWAVPVAGGFCVLMMIHWALDWWFVTLVQPGGPWSASPPEPRIEGYGAHVAFAAASAAVFTAAGYLAQLRGEPRALALVWSGVAVALPVLMLIAVYYRVADFERSIPFAGLALAMAAGFASATETLWRREPSAGQEAGAVFATGAVAGLALTLTFALEKGWLTVALALMVPGIAWISDIRPVPVLRKLCAVLVALVLARVLWDPRIVGDAVGTTPILNWLLWGYGVPALAFWYGGRLLRRQADDLTSRVVESAAITFAAMTALLEIRHLMNDGDIYRPQLRVGELGLQVSTALAMIIGTEHVWARAGSLIHDGASRILGLLATLGLVDLLTIHNPVLTGAPVGGMVFNHVLLGYGLPAVLLGVLARRIRFSRPQAVYMAAAVAAIVMMLAYLTLEVRTVFQGPVLRGGRMSDAEDYAYSAVWLAFGVALLIVGVWLKSQPARLASAAVVVLTVAKVFLHDLAGVQGIYRALSFIGLGLVLMGIGWLYQRLLFPARRDGEEVASGAV